MTTACPENASEGTRNLLRVEMESRFEDLKRNKIDAPLERCTPFCGNATLGTSVGSFWQQ